MIATESSYHVGSTNHHLPPDSQAVPSITNIKIIRKALGEDEPARRTSRVFPHKNHIKIWKIKAGYKFNIYDFGA